MIKVRRVLISVWNKKGLLEFARKLKKFNVEIISTGKTAALLKKGGLEVKKVSALTSFPEILSGRVKTLHPRVFGGILVNKRHPLHMEEIRNHEIDPIDMVVVNFYPFRRMVKEKLTFDQMLEYIDIGGPAMLRAAAKNFKNVMPISSPLQYRRIIDDLEANKGMVSENLSREFACEVFRITKEYDAAIFSFLKQEEVLVWDLEKTAALRYGENPHQKAGVYKLAGSNNLEYVQLQGKPLSFNNLCDLDAAVAIVKSFTESAAAIIKHASPCGVACNKKLNRAYEDAYKCDPVSSFGGVVGFNRKVDGKTAQKILKTDFKECIIAPSYSKEALKLFSAKKNIRVLEINLSKTINNKDIKRTVFGYLIQDNNNAILEKHQMKVVSKRKPTQREIADLLFAWRVVKFVKSNAIVVAKNGTTLGIGAGQPSRVGSVKIAIGNAARSVHGGVLASDGFFPKPDSIKLMKKYGIKAIIQPGGSIKDPDIIELCNKSNLAMVFTGLRHFRH
ncbi:MAG: bifunctional phosphoribosylaminoimidazolecarboxamide formyltransferase/IMP cyclohydrolase [Candidatus Omnitrophica bacterium]|nr:bifunctional phosphoribosylaminoimidazolecarboxamide formyltransferase/IMP cyclohydrolase [Candidatus Omnitrophota bacterium]